MEEKISVSQQVNGQKANLSLWSQLGPGIVLAMMGIGTSHLILTPLAGARYGFALLWIIVLAYLIKYYVFSLAQFYTSTTGETLMQAYDRIPGPRNWAIWMILVFSILLVVLLAGIFGIVGTILNAAFPVFNPTVWSIISIVAAIALLMANSFNVLENINKVMAIVLVLMALIAFFSSPPSAEFFTGLIPTIPEGSMFLIASLVGLLPTGGLISLSYSEWTHLKLNQLGAGKESNSVEEIIKRRKFMTRDFWVGHWGSMVLTIIFLSLGATVLYGSEELPGGINLALYLSKIFTESLGQWVFPIFIAGIFSAIFATGTNGMDGMSRLIGRALSALSSPQSIFQKQDLVYRGALLFMGLLAMIINLGLFDPVFLVQLGAFIELVDVPLLLTINLYIVQRFIKQPELRLPQISQIFAYASIVILIGITVLALVY